MGSIRRLAGKLSTVAFLLVKMSMTVGLTFAATALATAGNGGMNWVLGGRALRDIICMERTKEDRILEPWRIN